MRRAPGVGGPREIVTLDFAGFRRAVSESYVPLRVRCVDPDRFVGRIHVSGAGDIHVSQIESSAHSVERTPELIAGGDRKYFKLSLQVEGSSLLVQDSREAVLRPGDIAVYDTSRPYSLVSDDRIKMMVLMFHHSQVDLPVEAMAQLTAVRFARSEGLAGMIGPFLEQLSTGVDRLSGPTGSRLANHAVDMVTTMFANELDLCAEATGHRALAMRIRAYIEENLGDPQLDPTTIAAAHFISTRHLHGVFREEGATVSTWIRTRRLEHCRRDLADPLQVHRAIGTIAARWGFIDAAHFSRLYKSTFGHSPTDARRACLDAARDDARDPGAEVILG